MLETHKRGAVLYDALLTQGGAEGLTLKMAKVLSAEIVSVDFRMPNFPLPAGSPFELRELGRPRRHALARHLMGLWHFTFRTRFLADFDWAIFSGSLAPCAARWMTTGRRILYCHAPPRFAYDLKDFWLARVHWWQRPFLRLLAALVRWRFEKAVASMDVILANSENVRGRIQKFLKRDSIVVYPACEVDEFRWQGQENFYVSTGRLEPFKRVRMIVEAFLRMPNKRLVVTSGGSELASLQALAAGASNIRFTGWLSRTELAELLGRSIASIYIPLDEDFGISPVESMAAGKPVIGVAEGGLQETVLPGKTGLLVAPSPTCEDIIEAVETLTPSRALAMRTACEARAEQFTSEIFARRLREVLDMR